MTENCCVCDSTGGSIVQPRTSTPLLHVESHHAVRHAVLTDARHVLITARPRREDLAWNLHPALILRLHALHLREHAKDLGEPASLW